jgi:hypothetical protein
MSITKQTLTEHADVHVDLYHCASMHGTHEQQRATMRRLESLVDTGPVSSLDRHAWAHTLDANADDQWCQEARSMYARFWSWAKKHDRTLEPAFGTRTVRSLVDDETHDVITFPVLCIAVYVDGELVEVAPTTDGTSGETYTVPECLNDLESSVDAMHARATT